LLLPPTLASRPAGLAGRQRRSRPPGCGERKRVRGRERER